MDIFSISIAAFLLICVIATITFTDNEHQKQALRIALWTLVAGILIGIEIQKTKKGDVHAVSYTEINTTKKNNY